MLYHSLAESEHSRYYLEFMLLLMAAPLPLLLTMLLCQGSFLLFLPLHYELLKGDNAKSHLLTLLVSRHKLTHLSDTMVGMSHLLSLKVF